MIQATRLLLTLLILLTFASPVHASTLRDFRNTQELEGWLEAYSQDKPPIVLTVDASGVARFYDICVPIAEAFIKRANEQGYKVERFRIASPDYYRYWYNAELKLNEGHGVGLVRVNGKEYLVEPMWSMAWELTVSYAGKKVGIAWE